MPLVLLSGLLSNETLWRHQIDHLSESAEILVISATENTPDQMVKAILDVAPPKFVLAGHSMGGWLALEVIRKASERVVKLCLLNTTARPDSAEKKALRQSMIQRAKEGEFSLVVDELVDVFVFHSPAKPSVKKMFLEVGKETFIRQEQSMLIRKETASILPQIRCPTLVVHAAQDRLFGRDEAQELVSTIPGAKLSIIEGCGHMSPLEMPQDISWLLKSWLI